MSTGIINHLDHMIQQRGQTLSTFGKDSTGKISYQINDQGFRGAKNFDVAPDYAFFGCSLVFGIGVPEKQTFPYLFENSQNYGLAGQYNNHDVMQVLEKFLQSDLYNNKTHVAVVWHARDSDCLEDFYFKLKSYNIIHFFCGKPLNYQNCYPAPPNQDFDVSGTHYGINSHRILWKTLCALFRP